MAAPMLLPAAPISLVGNDGLGTSSFTSGANWAGSLTPSAGNDYNTAAYQMRTPGNTTTAYTFAGDSLTLGNHGSAGAGNGSLLEKFSSGAGSIRTLTINNLTNSANAIIRSGGTAGALIHIAGNHYSIAGNSSIWADQCIWVIDSPLIGGDSVILTNFANNANDHVAFTADNSAFTGSLYLTGGGTTAWSLEFDAVNSVPGNPSSFNAGQITFLGTGQLRDTVGCLLTNSNGGITLAANGTINTSATTLIGEPITDLTNGVHSLSALTSSGSGTLILSNANNNYYGGTTISAGILQLGVDNGLPANTPFGDVTDNATLDLNGHSASINGLNGTGIVDTTSAGTPTLTVGANGTNGTFSGTLQNSAGTLTLAKIGSGTETLTGGFSYSGDTIVAGGTLVLNTSASVPSSPGNLMVSNAATLSVIASSGTALPANQIVVGTNSSLTLTLNGSFTGVSASGDLTLQDNATNNFSFGTVTGNPTAPAINVAGTILAPGTNIVINLTATGLKTGTFTLIKYGAGALASIANIQVNPPPGVAATLVNNTHSLDLTITSTPNQLAWNGVNGTSWDLITANWTNIGAGGITVFQQYTNGSVIAGDAVTFDDTLTNDFVNPQPTNIVLNSRLFAFPVVVNSTLPYSIAGAGGILGVTSLVKSNTGSLTLLTSNSFAGGVSINDSGSLIITNDSALGASSGAITLNGSTLQINGPLTNSRALAVPASSTIAVGANNTARLAGVISGAGGLNKADSGTLILAGRETFGGNLFGKGGTLVIDSGGSINNGGNYSSIGQNGTDNATLTLRGTGAFTNSADFNVGDVDTSVGTLNIQDSAVLNVNAFWIGSANAAGSTASGTLNMSGGTLIERSTTVGTFDLGGRNSGNAGNGMGVINLTNGYISIACGARVGDYGTGVINQYGGTLEATNNGTGINLRRQPTAISGTYNLNGGTLRTEKVTSSQPTGDRLFYFNGGTLQAGNGNLGTTPFMNNLSHAYVRNGGAVIDSQGYNIIISQPLEHSAVGGDNAVDGGLTKKGAATLTMTGTNTFTGSITNNAGTLFLNSPSTYAGSAAVNAGTLQILSGSTIQGSVTVSNKAIFTVIQQASGTATVGDLTLNGGAAIPGAAVGLSVSAANNPNVALLNCGTLTLNGTNTIIPPATGLGTFALIKYTSIAGSGSCTNLALPQGASGYLSNDVANSTFYVVITDLGSGLVWTGTNSAAGKANFWDINTTTNWLLGAAPTSYHQLVVPGDSVTFNDLGSGTVLLSNSVAPTVMVISNNARNYTFSGTGGNISGPAALVKLGAGTVTLNLNNNSYGGGTVISNGTVQAGIANALSPNSSLTIGPNGTFEMATLNQTATELLGGGIVDNNGGVDTILTVGTSAGGTWNGTIQDQGHGGVALIKSGSGTWIVGGVNSLNNGSPFTTTNIFAAGTTIITNGGAILSGTITDLCQLWQRQCHRGRRRRHVGREQRRFGGRLFDQCHRHAHRQQRHGRSRRRRDGLVWRGQQLGSRSARGHRHVDRERRSSAEQPGAGARPKRFRQRHTQPQRRPRASHRRAGQQHASVVRGAFQRRHPASRNQQRGLSAKRHDPVDPERRFDFGRRRFLREHFIARFAGRSRVAGWTVH